MPTITGTVTDETLTADTSAVSDADGLGAFSYQWLRNGVAIGGATASIYTLDDTDAGAFIEVDVSYTDGQGTTESLTSAAVGPVADVNDAPGGAVSITGVVMEDQILTADTAAITDADGLGAFSYQWLRSTDGGATWSRIAGATAASYTLGDADVGTLIQVRVVYTDGQGSAEGLTSVSVGPVVNVNDAPAFDVNTLAIGQGQRQILSTANLAASDIDDAAGTLTFTVNGVTNGRFEHAGAPGVAIGSFMQADGSAGLIVFVHDGSAVAPSYAVTVSDGAASDGPLTASVSFTPSVVVLVPLEPSPVPTASVPSAAEPAPQPERAAVAVAPPVVRPALFSPGRIDPPDAQLNEFEPQAADFRRLIRPVATLSHFTPGPHIDPTLQLLAAAPANLEYLPTTPVDSSVRAAFPISRRRHATASMCCSSKCS